LSISSSNLFAEESFFELFNSGYFLISSEIFALISLIERDSSPNLFGQID